jgi:hypothetical protein
MRKIIAVLFSLMLSFIICLGLLLLLEIGFRAVGNVSAKGYLLDAELFPYHQYLVSTHTPNLVLGKGNSMLDKYFAHGSCDEEGGVTARFNSLGFRSPEFLGLPPKKQNEFRIVLTGGSVTESWNVGEKGTLDRQLEKRLRTLRPDIDFKIFNISNGAWISFQELIAMQLYGLDIKPDLVIDLNGFTDIEHAYYMPINAAYSNGQIVTAFERYKSWLRAGPFDLFKEFKAIPWLRSLFSPRQAHAEDAPPAHISKYPKYAQKPTPGYLATAVDNLPVKIEEIRGRTDFDPYNKQVVDNYLKNMQLMARSLSTINTQLIVALQPTLYLKYPLSADEERVLWKYYEPELNFVILGYIRMQDGLSGLAKTEPNLAFCDLTQVFKGDNRTLHGDYVHTNETGYGIIAAELAKCVSDYIEKKNKR